jgi:serine/threonine protein kinase
MQNSPNTPNIPISQQIMLGQTKLGDYTKLSVLGRGTYGEVHKCVHTQSGQIVAMKTYIFEVSVSLM